MRTTSVLINNYNNGAYIADCVDSVLSQSIPPDEVIVYDDGSTDQSVPVLRGYGTRITLIEGTHDATRPSRENQANAVYRAFERSSGDWLFLLDGDDAFAPNKIERVLQALFERPGNFSLIQSPMTLINDQGSPIGRYRDPRFHQPDLLNAIYHQHDVDYFYPTSAMVVSRSALSLILPLDMTLCPELACDTRIGMLTPLLGEVLTLDECLVFWRRHSGSYISALARSRWFPAQQTYRRIRTFNRESAEFGSPRLSLWLNQRFRRQLIGALLPASLRRRWRATGTLFHGEPAKQAV
jgi:glycosyltransferase involved in cell wall biosynthesis